MATTNKGIYYPNDYAKVADVPEDMKKMAESIDTAIDNATKDLAKETEIKLINESIESINETNTKQDKKITDLQQENEELKAENERLRQDMNAYPSNEAEGEYITLNDSADSRFNKFKVLGKSTQATRSGKNMVHVTTPTATTNGITFTNNEDGSVTINGTATANAYFNVNIFSGDVSSYFICTKNEYYGLYIGKSAEGLNFVVRSKTKNYPLLQTDYNTIERVQQYTDETDEECYAYLMVQSGKTINNLTVYPMIVHGTEIGDYEVYGAMPSPEFKSDIQNVTGDVDIIVANSNLFGKGFSTPKTDANFWHTVGIGFTSLEDGWGRLELDNSASSSTGYMNAWSRMSNFLNVIKPSTKYKIIVEWRNLEIGTNISSNYLCICGNNNQEAFKGSFMLYYSTLTTTNKSSIEIITKDNIKPLPFLLRTFISVRAGERLSLEVRISIQSVDTNADYEDGQNQQYVFPLQEGQILSEGDYLADDGIHHVRKQVELDGTEGWQRDNNSYNYFYIYINDMNKNKVDDIICSHFTKGSQTKQGFWTTSVFAITIDAEYIGIQSGDNADVRINKFKNWLKEQKEAGTPVTVEYELLEEEIEPYTEEQQKVYDEIVNTAKTYKTVTNIFSTNEVSPVFEVNYRKDIETMINNVNKAVLNNA